MKKFLSAIISGAAGILSLVFLALPAFTVDMGIMGEETYSGWQLLTNKDIADMDLTAVTWYRIFAWILVVLAAILIVLAVLQLLSSLGVMKMPTILVTINNFALVALFLAAVLALIANFGIRSETIDAYKDLGFSGDALKEVKDAFSVGASLWAVSITGLVASLCGKIFGTSKK